jgi:hypothetical protein
MQGGDGGNSKWIICKKLKEKLVYFAFDEQPLEPSFAEFEDNERIYL